LKKPVLVPDNTSADRLPSAKREHRMGAASICAGLGAQGQD